MANEIFDRETGLDLLVNIIPLFILAFFIIVFLVFAPFGVDPLASSIQFGLIAIPFVLLTVLTYFAGRAVAGSEKSGPVYLPGQASVRGATPLETPEDDAAGGENVAELGDDPAAALDGERADEAHDAGTADSEAPGSEQDGDDSEKSDSNQVSDGGSDPEESGSERPGGDVDSDDEASA